MSCRSFQRTLRAVLLAVAAGGAATPASADVIVSAVDGTINSGGPGFGSLTDTFNQAGLDTTYVSGVTDFDAYIAGDPRHTVFFNGFEWFSNAGTSAASVTYDLGAVLTINRVALWNEEGAGIGLLSLFGSTDGVSFSPLVLDVVPTDNPASILTYGADVFGFAPTDLRYVRFDMSDCPQPNPGEFPGCAIGEVAFAEGRGVPEPASTTLLGLGLAVAAVARRRRANR